MAHTTSRQVADPSVGADRDYLPQRDTTPARRRELIAEPAPAPRGRGRARDAAKRGPHTSGLSPPNGRSTPVIRKLA